MPERVAWTVEFSLVVLIAAAAAAFPRAASQTQATPLPTGRLTFGASTAEFRADGTFIAEASIDGMNPYHWTGHWKVERDIVEFTGWNTKGFEFLGPRALTGCEIPGRYRYAVEGAHVRFENVADTCEVRLILLDGSRWRPVSAPNTDAERRITRAAAKPVPTLPRASDPAGSWPSFRGPQAGGVADGQQLPDRWDGESGEHILWRTPIPGLGHSSPILWGDRLFVTSAISSRGEATFKPGRYGDGTASDDRSPQRWMLYALDRRTGNIVWERTAHEGAPLDRRHIKSTYASATPATDGRVVVAWFGSQGVHAYTVNGDFLWRVDLGRVDVGANGMPAVEWGPASSPIVWNDLVILQVDTQADSLLIALALETGEVVWKTERDEPPSWSTPTVVSTAAGPELVTNASNYVRGYDPRTGSERWRLRGGGGSMIPVPTPILGDGLLVLSSTGVAGKRPLTVVRPGARGDISLKEAETTNASVAWSQPVRGSYVPTPLAYRGVLYVLANNGVLDAYDLKTGEEIYRQRLPEIGSGFSASPVAADGKIYLINEDGQMVVIAAGREFRHIATNPMGELMMATPALSRGAMYARGARHVIAIAGSQQQSPLARVKALGLETATVGRVTTYFVPADRQRAEELATLADRAAAFHERELGVSFDFAVAALPPDRWFQEKAEHEGPHTIPWESPAERLILVPARGERLPMTFTRSIDFIALHEYGHLAAKRYFHPASSSHYGPVPWFEEFIATYFGYAFVRSSEPQWANRMRQEWAANVKSYTPRERSLDWRFILKLPPGEIGQVYGWYQNLLNLRVADVYEQHGVGFLRLLKERLPWSEMNDWTSASLLPLLEQIAPGFQAWADGLQRRSQ